MRLTTVAQMALPEGSLHSFAVRAAPDPSRELPVSFDQGRHVGRGDRSGSWMAVSFRLAQSLDRAALAQAWREAIARHGTLRTVFSFDGSRVRLHEAAVDGGMWREHDAMGGGSSRDALRTLLDAECRPCAAPSYLLAVVVPAPAEPDPRPVVVLASDHAHVDMWSLLILAHEVRTRVEDDGADGASQPGAPADPLPAAAFVDHTRALAAMPEAPAEIIEHWQEILRAGGGGMPAFPLPLGDVSRASPAVVEVRDVLDSGQLARLEERADAHGVRILPLVLSELAQLFRDVANVPLRAVFPVHSRNEPRWRDSVGWYITNAVLDIADPDPSSCAAAVAEAVRLGAHPLAPIFDRIGSAKEPPGMFAISWLDMRRLPLGIDPSLEPQFVSAVLPTDNIMIWFIVAEDGLHLRCRYPDNAVARSTVGAWLDELTARVAAATHGGPGRAAPTA
ncbi:peptide synthetase [Sinomonas sp. ASV322]|uniref:peptide synthetase n=1 Tax=Sinomonas sp. ASV322 TaxID=3041920 RepID=UPI0027DB4820|nr:peptide synthetase [Sinomonas sp. ASV322]MDQ4504079.1 peptide synthetase [Sinomonas sp. ASV322]